MMCRTNQIRSSEFIFVHAALVNTAIAECSGPSDLAVVHKQIFIIIIIIMQCLMHRVLVIRMANCRAGEVMRRW